MGASGSRTEDEIKRLRDALDAEARRCVEVQRRLDRANTEFEEFISIAAHNLREHLRDVASYSQLVAETYARRLDSDADLFLEHIRVGAANAQSLLAGILDYWAADADDRQASPTEMEAVLDHVLLSADKQITQRGAIVTHDPLPTVMGDFEILTKVLHHLVMNAIAFCASPVPRVHISSRRDDDEWVFVVQDNGLGIDPTFQDRIFKVFTRLHGKEHPGNGLGLAFCKKAIERRGGRVWMESTAGRGSTFYFTVPTSD